MEEELALRVSFWWWVSSEMWLHPPHQHSSYLYSAADHKGPQKAYEDGRESASLIAENRQIIYQTGFVCLCTCVLLENLCWDAKLPPRLSGMLHVSQKDGQ